MDYLLLSISDTLITLSPSICSISATSVTPTENSINSARLESQKKFPSSSMSPKSGTSSSEMPDPLLSLSDTWTHRVSVNETTCREPINERRETTYFYCCRCGNGPHVLAVNLHCSGCYHQSCVYCIYKKW